jgi:hypothetical protein
MRLNLATPALLFLAISLREIQVSFDALSLQPAELDEINRRTSS